MQLLFISSRPKLIFKFILQPSVDIKTVLSQLMDRLSNYAAMSPEVSKYISLDQGKLYIIDINKLCRYCQSSCKLKLLRSLVMLLER
jgi:hypothetical protein